MRSQEEIVAKIHDVEAAQWNEVTKAARPPRQQAIDYMDFAWDKANNCRGISASRSLDHFAIWLWLDGDDELWPTLSHYQYYGKDKLRDICKYLGLDPDKWDDGVRTN